MKSLTQIKKELLFAYDRYRTSDDYEYTKIIDDAESVSELFRPGRYTVLFLRICSLPVNLLMD